MSDFRLDECMDAVASKRTAAAMWAEVCTRLGALGVDGVFHGDIAPTSGVIRCNIDPAWDMGQDPGGYAERDPFFTFSCQTLQPSLTGPDFLHLHPGLSHDEREFIEKASVSGFTAGMAIPTRKRSSRGVAGWHLLSSDGRSCIEDAWQSQRQALTLFAHTAHNLFETAPNGHLPELTPREADCLKYLASGLKSKAIAHELGIRPVTVEFHFANARSKLGAKSREHALALALKHHLISF